MPAFCKWATKVCDFIDWFQKEPELKQDDSHLDVENKQPDKSPSDFDQDYLTYGGQCPTFQSKTISVGAIAVPLSVDMTPMCDFAKSVRPAVLALAYLAAMAIVASAIRDS